MKYATIGTGWITRAFVEGAMLSGNMRLGAVYSRSAEKAREFGGAFGCGAVFDDIAKLAAYDGVEAVYVASPNSLHYEQCRLLLENGKHIICEKPITVTLGQYDELVSLAQKNGLIYMEAIMFMHHPHIADVNRAVGELGNITTARLDFSQLSSKYDAYREGKRPNVFNPGFAGGSLMDMSSYCLYPAIEWFGRPEGIYAHAGILDTGADGYVNGLLVYPDKQVGITMSKIGQSRIGSEVMGDRGTLVIEYLVLMEGIWLYDRKGNRERVTEDLSRGELMCAEADAFYGYVREPGKNQKEYLHMQECAREVMSVTDAMHDMIRGKGRP